MHVCVFFSLPHSSKKGLCKSTLYGAQGYSEGSQRGYVTTCTPFNGNWLQMARYTGRIGAANLKACFWKYPLLRDVGRLPPNRCRIVEWCFWRAKINTYDLLLLFKLLLHVPEPCEPERFEGAMSALAYSVTPRFAVRCKSLLGSACPSGLWANMERRRRECSVQWGMLDSNSGWMQARIL